VVQYQRSEDWFDVTINAVIKANHAVAVGHWNMTTDVNQHSHLVIGQMNFESFHPRLQLVSVIDQQITSTPIY
jgi:adenosine deaminase